MKENVVGDPSSGPIRRWRLLLASCTLLWSLQSTTLCQLIYTPKQLLKEVAQVSLFDLHQSNWNAGSDDLPRITRLLVVHGRFKVRSSNSRSCDPKVIALHWKVRYGVYIFTVVWSYETLGVSHLLIHLRNTTEGCGPTLFCLNPTCIDICLPITPTKKVKLVLEGGNLFGHALIVKMYWNFL